MGRPSRASEGIRRYLVCTLLKKGKSGRIAQNRFSQYTWHISAMFWLQWPSRIASIHVSASFLVPMSVSHYWVDSDLARQQSNCEYLPG